MLRIEITLCILSARLTEGLVPTIDLRFRNRPDLASQERRVRGRDRYLPPPRSGPATQLTTCQQAGTPRWFFGEEGKEFRLCSRN
jgi:hypothetical protein